MSPAFFDFNGLPPVLGWLELDNLERDLDGDEPDWICGSGELDEEVGMLQPEGRRSCCCRALFFFDFTSECLRDVFPAAVFTSCRLPDFRRSFGKTSVFELLFVPSGGVPLPASSKLALLLFRNSVGRRPGSSAAATWVFAAAIAILLVDSEPTLRLDRLLVVINHEMNEQPHDTLSITGSFTSSRTFARATSREWRVASSCQKLSLVDGTGGCHRPDDLSDLARHADTDNNRQ